MSIPFECLRILSEVDLCIEVVEPFASPVSSAVECCDVRGAVFKSHDF